MGASAPRIAPAPEYLHRWRMLFFSTTVGIVVANLYYAQPLLASIALSFGQDMTRIGFAVTLTQIGYALGILLLVPLADVLDHRKMLTVMLAANAVGLSLVAASPDLATFVVASFAVGATSSAIMVIIPHVASHAPHETRGRMVGQLVTGLLLGILLARTVSGAVATAWGWRVVFALATCMVLLLLVVLRIVVRSRPPRHPLRYGQLLHSLLDLMRKHPELRRRSVYAMLGLGTFSVLWTGLTFLLSAPPYEYSAAGIGMFGLIGAAGALSATVAGRLGDAGHAGTATGVLGALTFGAWCVLAFAEASLAAVAVGIFLLDIGVQGLQVTHQSIIYRLAPEASSRITAIFVTFGFTGAALGSAIASVAYAMSGWPGVCLAGASLPFLLFLAWTAARRGAPAH
jgi:predicted MFS family arabinose efflux permease